MEVHMSLKIISQQILGDWTRRDACSTGSFYSLLLFITIIIFIIKSSV